MRKNVALVIFVITIFISSGFFYIKDVTSEKVIVFGNSNATLPDSTLAPGDVLSNNTNTICITGYSSTVRDVSESLKKEIYTRDNVSYPQPRGSVEVDHIIPLCLGGSNSEDNLFVQFAEPRPGFKEKDKLEVYLCRNVCLGNIDINYAQQRIASDWYAYYREIYGN